MIKRGIPPLFSVLRLRNFPQLKGKVGNPLFCFIRQQWIPFLFFISRSNLMGLYETNWEFYYEKIQA